MPQHSAAFKAQQGEATREEHACLWRCKEAAFSDPDHHQKV
jgi:hypothetical protein